MAVNYSAHQFDSAFLPSKLGNWEVPRKTIKRPSLPKGPTQVICDENGRFLSDVTRPKGSPWSKYRNTWQLPERITRYQANELNGTLPRRKKTAKDNVSRAKDRDENANSPQQLFDEKYIPGDVTDTVHQHQSRSILLDRNSNQQPNLNELYTEKHNCIDPVTILDEQERTSREKTPHILGEDVEDNWETMRSQKHIPDKPTERTPSPLIPAHCNFQMAKKMAQENLEHQPLPDCIMDRAFRKLQVQGDQYPGLALDVMPSASGVGIKTYKAGPTHCTKMKIYRPKTCGVVPKPVSSSQMHRPQTCFPGTGKQNMNSMDLAICWDYRPSNPLDEPRPPKHIDGSNGSSAPAVFTLVKTPRTPENLDTGRSAGIFTNTLGDEGFFDKDILRRKTSFTAPRSKSGLKCSCGTSPINLNSAKSSRSQSASRHESLLDKTKRCKSSPNLSQIVNVGETTIYNENHDPRHKRRSNKIKEHTCTKYGPKKPQPENITRIARLCHKQESQSYPDNAPKLIYKSAFKAGLPKSNSSGTVTSFDSGCSTMSSSGTSCSTKVLNVPKPRHPYAKKNYNIDTLVPPFACVRGGAGQGGYPEHWRLASVYQHAYKPIEQRKRPLLDTVYK